MEGGETSGRLGFGRLSGWRRWLLLVGRSLTLRRRIRRALPGGARAVLGRLTAAGSEAVLVGGAVRDLLLGKEPKDWDIAAGAGAAAIQALFPGSRLMGAGRGAGGGSGDGPPQRTVWPADDQPWHGTILVVEQGRPYEITPYRGATLADDLAARDFTVNAMALTPDGRLADPMGGLADLARKRLRACGTPADRLRADPLRTLRAIRLAAQFGFSLDSTLEKAIREEAPLLAGVAPERIGMEFGRMLVTGRPAWGMERLRELGLLAYVAPELLETVGVEQNQYHAFPVWEHLLMALALTPPVLPLRLAALLHDVAKPRTLSTDAAGNRHFYRHELVGAEMADGLLRRLRFDNESRTRAVHLIRYHMDLYADGPITDSAIRRMLRRIGPEYMNDLIQLRRADRLASGTRQGDLAPETIALLQQVERVLQADAALKVTDLAVDGEDVMRAFGRPPGPYVGHVLAQLLDEVVEEPSRNNRDWLLARLADLARL